MNSFLLQGRTCKIHSSVYYRNSHWAILWKSWALCLCCKRAAQTGHLPAQTDFRPSVLDLRSACWTFLSFTYQCFAWKRLIKRLFVNSAWCEFKLPKSLSTLKRGVYNILSNRPDNKLHFLWLTRSEYLLLLSLHFTFQNLRVAVTPGPARWARYIPDCPLKVHLTLKKDVSASDSPDIALNSI